MDRFCQHARDTTAAVNALARLRARVAALMSRSAHQNQVAVGGDETTSQGASNLDVNLMYLSINAARAR